MRRRRVAVLVAAVVAATALGFADVGPFKSLRAAAAACTDSQNQAFVTLKSTMVWEHWLEKYQGGGHVGIYNKRTIYSGPSGNATFTFCVGYASGEWTIRKAPDIVSWAYHNINSDMTTSGTGFLLRPGYVYSKKVVVEPVICRKNGVPEFFKEILSIPIKGLPFAWALAKYIVGQFIPEGETYCQAFASVNVPITFKASNGDTSASDFERSYFHKAEYISTECPYPGSCWQVDQWRWIVTTP